MNCPKCGGNGFVPTNIFGVNGAIKCDFCDGTGVFITNNEEPMTHEEWFNSLSTEEKAKYIAKSMFFYDSQFGLTMVEALRKSIEYEDGLNETIEHDVVEWLKQPHTTEVEK